MQADEAAAQAIDEANSKKREEHEAAKRLALLRGVTPPRSPSPIAPADSGKRKRGDDYVEEPWKREKRRRKRLNGEDDTDRDMRLAREDEEERQGAKVQNDATRKRTNLPITDRGGHIQLFAPEKGKPAKQNKEAEVEKIAKEREFEDQYTMRFSNAAGIKKSVKDAPWYLGGAKGKEGLRHSGTEVVTDEVAQEIIDKKYEGRQKRDMARMSAADPMAAMKSAQVKLKQVEKDREQVKRERERDLQGLRREQEALDKRYDGRIGPYGDDLEGFSLDPVPDESRHFQHENGLWDCRRYDHDRKRRHRYKSRDHSARDIRRDGPERR